MSKNKNPNKLPLGTRIQNATARMLYGRNGVDQLNILFLVLYCVFVLASSLVQVKSALAGLILSVLGFIFVIVFLVRTFSKKLDKRRAENAKFVGKLNGVKNWKNFQKKKWNDRNTHVYKKCPTCKKVLRVKKRKGTKTVNCPFKFSKTTVFQSPVCLPDNQKV